MHDTFIFLTHRYFAHTHSMRPNEMHVLYNAINSADKGSKREA